MTERQRQRKKGREEEGATRGPKRELHTNGQPQLTVMGSRQPLSVRVGVMPVNGDAVTNISGFRVLDCFQKDRNEKYTEGTDFCPLCAIQN